MHLLVLSTLICASFISNIAAQQPSPTSPPAPPPSTLSDIVSAINADLQGPKKCYYDCYNSVNILRIPSFVTTDTVTDFCLDFLFQPQPSADAITRLNMCISTPACISGLQKVGSNSVDIGSACSNLYRLGLMGPSTRSMMIPPRLPTGSVPSSTPPRTIRPAPTAIPDIITAINEVITKPPKCYFTCLAAEGIVFPFTSIKSVDDALAFCKFISDFNPPQEVLIKASQCAAKDPVCLASLIGMNEDMVDVDETCENLYTLQGGNSGVAVTGLPATLTRATNVAGSTVASSSVTNSSKVSAAGKGQEPSILVMGLVGLAATMFLL